MCVHAWLQLSTGPHFYARPVAFLWTNPSYWFTCAPSIAVRSFTELAVKLAERKIAKQAATYETRILLLEQRHQRLRDLAATTLRANGAEAGVAVQQMLAALQAEEPLVPLSPAAAALQSADGGGADEAAQSDEDMRPLLEEEEEEVEQQQQQQEGGGEDQQEEGGEVPRESGGEEQEDQAAQEGMAPPQAAAEGPAVKPWDLISPMFDKRSSSWLVRCNQVALAR